MKADPNFPGTSREPPQFRAEHIPTIAREAISSAIAVGRAPFPFESWALANRFSHPKASAGFLSRCESAAEAYFAREFVARPGVVCSVTEQGLAMASQGAISMSLQVPCAAFRIDVVVAQGSFRLAVEVDGLGFHVRRADQVSADYLRERRIVCAGYTLVRFTAGEVFGDAAACWRQVDAILLSRRSGGC